MDQLPVEAAKPNIVLIVADDMGMADVGAMLAWVSQEPSEAEVLFRPLSQFEVVSAEKRLLPKHLLPNAPKGASGIAVRTLVRAVESWLSEHTK